MKKNKLKTLILMLTLCVATSTLNISKTTSATSGENTTNPANTILDGEIGEWDPTIKDNPNIGDDEKAPDFTIGEGSQITEIEGTIPNSSEYFTISVTVPVEMEFEVFPSSYLAFGSFFSPTYEIKNNGSKTVVAKIASFERDENEVLGANETPLYIEEVVGGDGRTQMELNIGTVHPILQNQLTKEVSLIGLAELNDDERTLHVLEKNETGKIKFSSNRWEIPEYESKKKSAVSSYTAGFEFSIKEP